MTSSWIFLSTQNYDARSTTHLVLLMLLPSLVSKTWGVPGSQKWLFVRQAQLKVFYITSVAKGDHLKKKRSNDCPKSISFLPFPNS